MSLKIGDNRLDGIETGTALTRELIAVLANGCDIINMSFGGESATCRDATRARD